MDIDEQWHPGIDCEHSFQPENNFLVCTKCRQMKAEFEFRDTVALQSSSREDVDEWIKNLKRIKD